MLVLRYLHGLADNVFVNLLNFANSWSTLPESLSSAEQPHRTEMNVDLVPLLSNDSSHFPSGPSTVRQRL